MACAFREGGVPKYRKGGKMGGTRFELVTSSVSTKRSPPELTAKLFELRASDFVMFLGFIFSSKKR